MPFGKNYFLCLFFLCTVLSAAAQQADFTADKTSGCSPLAVSFTNTSTGFSGFATYSWDFGNTNRSALESPGTTYNEENIYTVTLTVTEGTIKSSKSMQITVYKKPVVNFSANISKGCTPLPVIFTSTSTPGDGTISDYTWDYGDGIIEKGTETQLHTYNIAKIISPSLTVTNSHGCYSTLSKPLLIEIFPLVYASFIPSKTVLCKVQDAVTFTNTSAGTGTLTYNWDFGDGAVSTTSQPQHIYNKKGIYPVKLSVTSADGCVSDTVLPINVAEYRTNFTVPASICQNAPALFTDISKPLPTSEKWLIDGAPFYNTDTVQHVFSTPGTHQVQLANVYETCPDTELKKITVLPSPVTTGFVAFQQGSCGAPVTVAFTDTSKNAVSWDWDFTNNGTATASGQTASYLYTADSVYNVTLKTTGANGCTTQVTQAVSVHKAIVSIKSSTGDIGCETKQTVFSAISEEEIAVYDWNFGDGGTSSEATPDHTFTAPGDYNITLQYVTVGGCKGKADYIIHVYEKPQFDFTAIPGTTICGSNPVTFNVTGSNLAGTYNWNYGDTDMYVVKLAPYTHQYQYDSVYTVSLIIDNNGCRDTVTKIKYLTVLPPFPHISGIVNTCNGDRSLVSFQDTSHKSQSYSWNFGDGSSPYSYKTQQPQVQHQYKQSGSYLVTLTTTNGTCSATDSASVYVLLKQTPVLSAVDATFCSNDTFHTTVAGIDNNPYTGFGNLGYSISSIQYKDGSSFAGYSSLTDSSEQHSFGVQLSNVDVNQTQLRIITTSDYFGCADTTSYLPFEALGPIADFSVTQNNICFKTPAVFTDQSKPSHNSPITKWIWNFGDSLSQTNNQGTTVSHHYPEPETYIAMLTVTDANNCSSSTPVTMGYVTVKGPQAMFTISENPTLPTKEILFYNHTNTLNTNSADNKYTWNYGDGTILKNQNYTDPLTHSYALEGLDTVTLIATNASEHCADTTSQVVYVKNPNLSYTYATSFLIPGGGCPPVIASFASTSVNTTRLTWDFGDGSGITGEGDHPSHVYATPGVYKVTLYGYFLDNTMDSFFQMITIQGPYAVLSVVKPYACGAELITLTAASSNTKDFTWDFGDGTVISNSDTSASHRYLTPNVYTPSLIVSDGSNCKFAFFPAKPIIIDTLHLAIRKRTEIACDSSLLLFTPDIVSFAKDSLGLPLTYRWSFGTGKEKDTTNTENSSFTYRGPGTYEVILSGASPYGCTDTTRDTIDVQPTPRAFIAGPAQICADDSVVFTGTATRFVTWSWQLQNGNTSAEQNPSSQIYTKPGLDSVSLIVNDNGCYDTAWHPLLVHARPAINPSPLSAHLCQGDSVQLQAHDGSSYQWTPKQYLSDANAATPYAYPDTATMYYVEVKNEAGCVSNDSIAITVTQRFTVTSPSPVYICPGGVAQLSASGADSYEWFGDGLSDPDIANPTSTVYEPKTFTVVGSDRFGCFTDTAAAQVLTAVLPSVEAGNNITVLAGTPAPLRATGSSDITMWQWSPGTFLSCDTCAATIITPRSDIQYVLKVTNGSGCTNFDTVQVVILCKGSQMQIPSAFTPNGDGRNDRFTVLGRGIKEIRRFAVFDRYGQPLFEKTHLSVDEASFNGWNGIYKNNPMPAGTYVYIADLVCDTGELFSYKGTVVLIR